MTTAPKRFAHGATPVVLAAGLAEEIEKKNAENAVVVYSKTYCTRGGVLCLLSGVLRRVCLTRDVVPVLHRPLLHTSQVTVWQAWCVCKSDRVG